MSGQPDIADILFDTRMFPAEPEDYDWQPGFEAERAYYDGGEGYPCPVCKKPKPTHGLSCWMGGEFQMSYQKTSIDYQEIPEWT